MEIKVYKNYNNKIINSALGLTGEDEKACSSLYSNTVLSKYCLVPNQEVCLL